MAAATNTTEGEILMAGDFSPAATGTLPVLRASGVSPGSYNYSSGGIDGLGNSIINIPNIVVDSKGRIVYAKVNPYTLSSTVATSSTFGMVKVNGTTITVNTGVISADTGSIATATSSVLGKLRPDNTTVTVAGGVLTSVVPKATSSTLGSVKPDNITTFVGSSAGTILVPEAYVGQFGIFRPDGITTTIDNATSTVSLQTATSTKKGIHRTDNTSISLIEEESGANTGIMSVRLANSTTFGRVRPDNTTIFVDSSGILSTPVVYSTAGVVGVSKADELTMSVIAGGVIKLADATSTQVGLVRPDNTTINISSGVLSRNIATSSVVGQVRPDNTTMNVVSGILSVPAATSSAFGVARNDNTTLIGSGGFSTVAHCTADRLGTATVDDTSMGILALTGILSIRTAQAGGFGFGIMQPDNVTTKIADGAILSIDQATSSTLGIVRGDNIYSVVTNGVLSLRNTPTLPTANLTTLGIVRVGENLNVADGIISAVTATDSVFGTVKIDASKLTVNQGNVVVDTLAYVRPYPINSVLNQVRTNYFQGTQSQPGSVSTTSQNFVFAPSTELNGNVIKITSNSNTPIDGFKFNGTSSQPANKESYNLCGAEIVLQLVETSAGFGFTFPATSVNNYGGFKVEGGSILPLTNGQMVVADMVVIRKNNLPFGLIYNQQIF